MHGICMCVTGPPSGGVCNACGALGRGYWPNNPTQPIIQPARIGWECPKCGAIMAPWMANCVNCKPKPNPTAKEDS